MAITNLMNSYLFAQRSTADCTSDIRSLKKPRRLECALEVRRTRAASSVAACSGLIKRSCSWTQYWTQTRLLLRIKCSSGKWLLIRPSNWSLQLTKSAQLAARPMPMMSRNLCPLYTQKRTCAVQLEMSALAKSRHRTPTTGSRRLSG